MGYPRSKDGTPYAAHPDWVLGQARFLRLDDGSAAINIDGLPAGAALVLWNGTGAGDTGGDWTHSGEGSEDPAADAGSGTNGLDTGTAPKDSTTLFDNGALLDVAGTYVTLRFQMNPQAFPAGSKLLVQFQKADGSKVGNELDVADYVTDYDLGVWQEVSIPIADFNLGEDVQKLQLKYAKEAGQQFYLDDFELLAAGGGGPYTFQVKAPDATKRYHVSMLVLLISGDSAGWSATTFANIAALGSGLLIRQRNLDSGVVAWSLNSKDNSDLFGRFHPQDDITFADGVLLVGFMVKPGKASIVVTDKDVIEVVVRDDLSGLDNARAFAHFGVETVEGEA